MDSFPRGPTTYEIVRGDLIDHLQSVDLPRPRHACCRLPRNSQFHAIARRRTKSLRSVTAGEYLMPAAEGILPPSSRFVRPPALASGSMSGLAKGARSRFT